MLFQKSVKKLLGTVCEADPIYYILEIGTSDMCGTDQVPFVLKEQLILQQKSQEFYLQLMLV